jgi:hypothetical protein
MRLQKYATPITVIALNVVEEQFDGLAFGLLAIINHWNYTFETRYGNI